MKKSFLFLIVMLSSRLWATDYYCDPTLGSMSNNGSSGSPWSSLHDVFAAGKTFNTGDIIYLRTGNHGFAVVEGDNTGDVTIRPEVGQNPYLERIRFGNNSASHWVLDGVTIQSINEGGYPENLVDLYPGASFITIKNCKIHSVEDASDWTRDNWRDMANTGIRAQGHDHLILSNEIKNVYLGAAVESPYTVFSDNIIQNFTIDGLRGLASYCTYEHNQILDAYVVYDNSENHYDGFQSYTCCPVGSDTIFDVKFLRNIIIQTTDVNRDFVDYMQGMGCFDGMYANWVIENNLIVTNHWHGISLYGAINCKIINNTVIDPDGSEGVGPTWIKIDTHKEDQTVNNGALSTGNIIRNNIVNQLSNADNIGVVDHNELLGQTVDNYGNYFMDYQNFDFHLLESAPAKDSGETEEAPEIDLEGNPRPFGMGIDIGAYEYKIPNAIEEAENYSRLYKVFPNPAKDVVQFNIPEPSDVRIFDAKGTLVYSFRLTKSKVMNIENLKTGIYTILFTNDKHLLSQKIVILK